MWLCLDMLQGTLIEQEYLGPCCQQDRLYFVAFRNNILTKT